MKKSTPIIILLAVLLLIGIKAHSRSEALKEYTPITVTVHHGETLSHYADMYRGEVDRLLYMDEVKRINGLSGALIYAGDTLTLPVYGEAVE